MASFGAHGLLNLIPIVLVIFGPSPCSALGYDLEAARAGEQARLQKSKSADDVYYVSRMADKFASFTNTRKKALDEFHVEEQKRLENAVIKATSDADKSLLEIGAETNEESRLEAQNALNQMMNFVTSLKQSMGSGGTAASCRDLSCGERAYCGDSEKGAKCLCQDGYEGDGFVCNPPSRVTPRALLQGKINEPVPQVADVSVLALRDHTIAVVFRDTTKLHKGYMMLGTVGLTGTTWTEPVVFSNESQAYSPSLVQLESPSRKSDLLAISFRDQDRSGTGMILGIHRDVKTNSLSFGPQKAYARNQAQQVALVPVSQRRVAILFSEHVISGVAGRLTGGTMFGTAALTQVSSDVAVAPEVIGKHRFASGAVSRITVAPLAPDEFVVAFRHGEQDGALKEEASCVVARVLATELVMDPTAVSLEPFETQIWARSVALVQDGVVSYTYHSGNSQLTKQAFLRYDPYTRRLSVLRKPEVIAKGFTPYVGTITTADVSYNLNEFGVVVHHDDKPTFLQKEGPRLFTYYNKGGSDKVQARICKVSNDGLPEKCNEMDWLGHEQLSVNGAAVGDGRVLFVTTDARGTPFYHLVGMLEADP